MINKYTYKLIHFLDDKFKSDYKYYDCENHELLLMLSKKFNELQYDEIKLSYRKEIKKIHTYDEYCLLYVIILKLYEDHILQQYHECDVNLSDFHLFLKLYCLCQ